jgi:hypothetical protein
MAGSRYELAAAAASSATATASASPGSGGTLFFGGGNAGVGGSDPHAATRVDIFDVESRTWRHVELPTGRDRLSAATVATSTSLEQRVVGCGGGGAAGSGGGGVSDAVECLRLQA